MLLPLGDPLLCSTDIDEGVVPLCVSGSENLQKLIAAGVVPADVAAYLNMNPSAVTLDGGYMSCSVMPPLHMTKCNGLEIPSLLSKDAMCVGHTIVFEEHSGCYQTILLDAVENKEGSIEHGNFAGYVIVWPGCRLSPTVTYDQWGSFLESVDSGSVELDASHVYYLEKRLACNSVLDNKTLRLTALRLSTGAFMPISREMLAYTMTYATYSTTPVSNLVAIKYWCPHEGITKTISRQYCDSRYYQKLFNRLLKLFKKAHCDIGYPINRGFNLSAEIVRSKEIVKRHIYSTSLPAEITRQSAVREYHLKVARWMRNSYKNGCPMILRDTSGQGKELEVAAFVASVFKSGDDSRTKFRGPFLIVCSQVSFSRWEAALKLFIPSTRYVCFCGSRINIVKQKKIWAAKQAYCAITSFDELEHERSFFVSNCYWNCVIVDQTADAVATVKCHAAKNNIPRVPCMVSLLKHYNKCNQCADGRYIYRSSYHIITQMIDNQI